MKLTKPFNVQQTLTLFTGNTAASWGAVVAVLQNMYTALSQNLTLGDNIVGQYSNVSLTTASTYLNGTFNPITIPWKFASKQPPKSVLIAQITVPSSGYQLLSAQSVQWTYNDSNGTISIAYVAGLSNSSTYSLVLEIK